MGTNKPTAADLARPAAPQRSSRVRLLVPCALTTSVLCLTTWVDRSELQLAEIVGIALWVCAVFLTLTAVSHHCEGQRVSLGSHIAVLAIAAGFASAGTSVALETLIRSVAFIPTNWASEEALWKIALVDFFNGDALFGFWALLIELPKRLHTTRVLENERETLLYKTELAQIRSTLEPHFVAEHVEYNRRLGETRTNP